MLRTVLVMEGQKSTVRWDFDSVSARKRCDGVRAQFKNHAFIRVEIREVSPFIAFAQMAIDRLYALVARLQKLRIAKGG